MRARSTSKLGTILFLFSAACPRSGEPGADVSRDPSGSPSRGELSPPELICLPVERSSSATELSSLLAGAVERALPSVASVRAIRTAPAAGDAEDATWFDEILSPFFGDEARESREWSVGSAVVITSELLLTSCHVVSGTRNAKVTLAGGEELDAEIVGLDDASDLAVLRVAHSSALIPIELGDSRRLRLGDLVLAIGNPFAVGETVTMGIVSGKGRADVGIVDYEDFIQTDAALNPGSSGGALIDIEGRLVGINIALLSRTGGDQGIGFAVPIEMARSIMQSLVENGHVMRGWIGITAQEMTQDLARALGAPTARGVVVVDVVKDSPAARAGIAPEDVIVAFDGEVMISDGKLRNAIAARAPKTSAELEIIRGTTKRTVVVEIDDRPRPTVTAEKDRDAPDDRLGLEMMPIEAVPRAVYRIPAGIEKGMVVIAVEAGSVAHIAGLVLGDVLLEIDRVPVTNARELSHAWSKAQRPLLLRVAREGRPVYVALAPPYRSG